MRGGPNRARLRRLVRSHRRSGLHLKLGDIPGDVTTHLGTALGRLCLNLPAVRLAAARVRPAELKFVSLESPDGAASTLGPCPQTRGRPVPRRTPVWTGLS